jgi:excisionase family DNA binding protein
MRKKHMEEKVYTVKEVASQLRVDTKTVRKWIRSGELTAIDIGGEYRVRQSALDDFIRRRERRDKPTDT